MDEKKGKNKPKPDGERRGEGKNSPRSTAAGESDGAPGIPRGKKYVCRIRSVRAGGYKVSVLDLGVPAILNTPMEYPLDADVIACFDGFVEGQLRFVDEWLRPGESEGEKGQSRIEKSHSGTDAGAKEPDMESFKVVSSSVPERSYQLRRAVDLLVPPFDLTTIKILEPGSFQSRELIEGLESSAHTGCLRISCDSLSSRGAALLCNGRLVGCIYGNSREPDTKPTEDSFNSILSDLDQAPDAEVAMYRLPDSIVLAFSSLFLGYPVERDDDYTTGEYLDYICDWFEREDGTATIAMALSEGTGMLLAFVFKGLYLGAFYVEDQQFETDRQFVNAMLEEDGEAALNVSILPPEAIEAAGSRFGFSLSDFMKL